jgi:hypothetical protein
MKIMKHSIQKFKQNTVEAKGKTVPTHAMRAYGASNVGRW